MTHEYIERYLALRKQGLIGKLWFDSEHRRLAPVDALAGLEWVLAEDINEKDLCKLIDLTWLLMLRKGMEREDGQNLSKFVIDGQFRVNKAS
jgi:hypothetical protein